VEGKRRVCQAESPRREEGNGCKEERSEMADRAQVSKLQWAVRGEDLSNLRNLLNSDKTLVNAVDYDQRTPLHVAALFDCRTSARVLLMQVGLTINKIPEMCLFYFLGCCCCCWGPVCTIEEF
jgi:ankyrin repeat protein